MKVARTIAAACLAAAALLVPGSHDAWSQSKPLRIVVPYPPASGPDILSRLMAEAIGRTQNQTVVVDNRPGGGTMIGTEVAMRSPPDGNTVLLVANSFVVNPPLGRAKYTISKDFDAVCQLASTPLVLVVNGDAPYKTLEDWLEAARKEPGKISLASGGPASALHIAFEVVKRAAKVDITYVPYPGTAPSINALLGKHVTAVFADYPTVVSRLKSGELRGLATTWPKRIPDLPNVPTVNETGLVKYEASIFYGIVAPANIPPDRRKTLQSWFTDAMAAPEIKAKLPVQGLFTDIKCGDEFGTFMNDLVEDYGRVIRDAKIGGPKK